ncbi:hypothetical protein T439DRAFT_121306 [Meredithblackwellia eburnea MCA 4105]
MLRLFAKKKRGPQRTTLDVRHTSSSSCPCPPPLPTLDSTVESHPNGGQKRNTRRREKDREGPSGLVERQTNSYPAPPARAPLSSTRDLALQRQERKRVETVPSECRLKKMETSSGEACERGGRNVGLKDVFTHGMPTLQGPLTVGGSYSVPRPRLQTRLYSMTPSGKRETHARRLECLNEERGDRGQEPRMCEPLDDSEMNLGLGS